MTPEVATDAVHIKLNTTPRGIGNSLAGIADMKWQSPRTLTRFGSRVQLHRSNFFNFGAPLSSHISLVASGRMSRHGSACDQSSNLNASGL
eukprot:6485162-Amphidinium_carterae.1